MVCRGSAVVLLLFLSVPFFTQNALSEGLSPGARDKCPVCGMFVAKYPDWITQIILPDGAYYYYDGVKDMFKHLKEMFGYIPANGVAPPYAECWVLDYYSLEKVNGSKAFYVAGSSVYGPMGKELIPFDQKDAAEEFAHDYGGKIYTYSQITEDLLDRLE